MRISALVLLISLSAAAQSIQITDGVRERQVLQRDADGKADLTVSGTAADADGTVVEARLARSILKGFDRWKKYGPVASGKWSVTIPQAPAGGPYKVEVRLAGSKQVAAVNDVFVGDIWVLAGQSNMEGVGDLIAVEQPHDRVQMLDMVDEKWQVAREPLHNLPGSVDRVHWRLNAEKQPERITGEKLAQFNEARKKGAGLGLPFGVAYEKAAGVPVGLLPCAHGGTSMDQWDPEHWDKANPGGSLYGSMMRRFELAGGKVRGVLWYQGESDANPNAVEAFREKFEKFVARVRSDFGNANLPFYYVQIGRHVNGTNVEPWNRVQEAQRLAESSIPNSTAFSSVDSDLDDQIHVSTGDLKRLGRNMALVAAGKAKRGPRLAGVRVEGNSLVVTFNDVNGKLSAPERIAGFSIHNASGEEVPMIYKAAVDAGQPNTVILYFQGKLPEGAALRYGWGKNPLCNLRDDKDFGILAFGPFSIQ